MKIKYLVGLTGCLLLVVLWYIWGSGRFEKQVDPAALVSDKALLYVEQDDVGRLIDTIKASHFGKTVAAMDIGKIAAGLELNADQTRTIEQAVESVAKLGNDPVFRELCGRSLSVALLPGEGEIVVADARQVPPVQLLLVAIPEHKAELLEVLSRAFTGKIKQSVISHGDIEIIQFDLDGTTFFAAVSDGLFVFSLNQKTIETALDLQRTSQGSLAALEEFAELKQQLPMVDFFAFSAPEKLGAAMAATLGEQQTAAKLAGLRYSIYGIWHEGSGFKDRTITLIDRNRLDPLLGRVLAVPSEDNDSLAFVSPDVQIYTWTNALALDAIWESINREGGEEAVSTEPFTRKFRELTGSDIEQVLTLFEPGISLQIQKGSVNGLIPLPRITLMFKVKDRVSLEKVLEQGVTGLGIRMEDQQYRNIGYRSYNPGLPGDIEALYGFYDHYLLVGNSRKMLEQIIDAAEDHSGFRQSEKYAALGMDLEHGSNSVFFIKVADIADGVIELATWTGAILALQDRNLALRSQVAIEEVIKPLLNGMTTISSVATRTFFAEDRVTVESTIEVRPDQLAAAGR
ncbi:hypothetical protein JWG42_02280 [Desulfoprunum benzoelyticum]|uniref:DUF3352 domain-containing protein n=1 Tax=Desulfoprunum benzoelyticum TaxID=1506996 RepID=A0A840UZU6_9BACT|nr:hypothetical protein [Desulfoprunum benzoelyticum]MBB5346491.1 hypothetical protein [Desulfoprunum benzoelyticum]MBM9528980.1 hypothetical protein [Desulfoprunum benzoelyticum]